jgi:hypothetical protein
MKAQMKNIKADLYHVFVTGDASNKQMLTAYLLLVIPFMAAFFGLGEMLLLK